VERVESIQEFDAKEIVTKATFEGFIEKEKSAVQITDRR
jgi:hypothetical protein